MAVASIFALGLGVRVTVLGMMHDEQFLVWGPGGLLLTAAPLLMCFGVIKMLRYLVR